MDLGCDGKTFLVMAASRGLGQAVADGLRAEGARVLSTSRGSGESLRLDIGDETSRRAFLDQVRGERFSGVFVNGGGPRAGDVLELSDEDWLKAFQQILLGPIHLVRALVPQMDPGSSILFNSSSSVGQPIPHLALSNVFRASLYALMKTLVDELSPQQIRVNLIVPGRVATERVRQLDEQMAARTHLSVEAVRQQSEAKIPLGRYGRPDEFGRLATFLLSPHSSYLNGQAYWIDGGQHHSL